MYDCAGPPNEITSAASAVAPEVEGPGSLVVSF